MTPLPNVMQAYSLLVQEEMEKKTTYSKFAIHYLYKKRWRRKPHIQNLQRINHVNTAIKVVIQLMSIESLGFTVNFVIEGDIQKIDVNIKIILEGQYKSINAIIENIDHLQI